MKTEEISLQGLQDDVRATIKESYWTFHSKKEPDHNGAVHEIVDIYTPTEYSVLARLLAGSPGLSEPDNYVRGPDKIDIFSLIRWSVFEKLNETAYEAIRELDEKEPWGWVGHFGGEDQFLCNECAEGVRGSRPMLVVDGKGNECFECTQQDKEQEECESSPESE